MVINEQVASGNPIAIDVLADDVGCRLDVFLARTFVRYSRSFFKKLIDSGSVLVNQQIAKSGYILRLHDCIMVTFPSLPQATFTLDTFEKDFHVEVVARDQDFLIVNKPAGLMVHKPNDFSSDVTLVDWLLASYAELKHVGIADRPGIIHRLDKDTSGLLVIPLNNESFGLFGSLFRSRKVNKLYWALVDGHPDKCGVIDFPIGRDPHHKHRMTHFPKNGVSRDALTSYRVLAYYPKYTLVEVRIVTGRTHQIRVHFAAIGHPVLGDAVYGSQSPAINRQALHAKKISFIYKTQRHEFECAVAADMQALIDVPTIET